MQRAFVVLMAVFCALSAVAGERTEPLSVAGERTEPLDALETRFEDRRIAAVALSVVREENALLAAASDYALPNVLVSGAADPEYWEARIADVRDRRAVLAEHGLGYTAAATDLTVDALDVSGETATLLATETTELTLTERATGTIVTTTLLTVPHRYTLTRASGSWRVVSDTAAPEFAALPPERASPALEVPEAGPIAMGEDRGVVTTAAVPKLDRSRVVAYALKYVGKKATGTDGYNKAYRAFPNDCTNFTSQALYDGGWTMVSGYYTSSSAWWYNWLNQSRPWINAQQWAEFTMSRPRGYLASTVGQLKLGDILQADFDSKYPMDHSTVVTGKDSAGTPLLTYHTSNVKNLSFWEFDRRVKQSYKNPTYYRWRLYDTIY